VTKVIDVPEYFSEVSQEFDKLEYENACDYLKYFNVTTRVYHVPDEVPHKFIDNFETYASSSQACPLESNRMNS